MMLSVLKAKAQSDEMSTQLRVLDESAEDRIALSLPELHKRRFVLAVSSDETEDRI